jgi:RNA polymerase sigma-70 factor (ECF subfamily)
MKVGSRFLVDAPSRASKMALAVEIQLPENALERSQSALSLLVERAAAGDNDAFEQIMIHSQQKVMAISWRILGNEADARDASQEVFLRVYKYLGRFKQDLEFVPWLCRITVNVCRDILKQRENRRDQFKSSDQELAQIPFEDGDAEQTVIELQRRELVLRAIAGLPFKERASIVLRDMEGLSTEEVARILKSSSTTVRSQISSARRKIRDYCRRYFEAERAHEL